MLLVQVKAGGQPRRRVVSGAFSWPRPLLSCLQITCTESHSDLVQALALYHPFRIVSAKRKYQPFHLFRLQRKALPTAQSSHIKVNVTRTDTQTLRNVVVETAHPSSLPLRSHLSSLVGQTSGFQMGESRGHVTGLATHAAD